MGGSPPPSAAGLRWIVKKCGSASLSGYDRRNSQQRMWRARLPYMIYYNVVSHNQCDMMLYYCTILYYTILHYMCIITCVILSYNIISFAEVVPRRRRRARAALRAQAPPQLQVVGHQLRAVAPDASPVHLGSMYIHVICIHK